MVFYPPCTDELPHSNNLVTWMLEVGSACNASSSISRCRCLNQKGVGVHGHMSNLYELLADVIVLIERKRVPTKTGPRSQAPSLLRRPMPPFPPDIRWYAIALSNVLTVRVLHDDALSLVSSICFHRAFISLGCAGCLSLIHI